MSLKILIVDDHQILRTGLRMIMATEPDLDVVGEAVDGQSGLAAIAELHPDVVLTDIRMPGMDGITMLTELRKTQPDLPVVVLTTFDDQQPIQAAMRLGARGFLLKDATADTIIATVRGAAAGKTFLEPAVLTKAFASSESETSVALTDREHEILSLVAQGSRNIDIADQLHLSERIIKLHLTAVYTKLGVFSRAEAVAAAIKQGLI
ncbi:response regulator [Lacticaseibacillus sharpeae]|uniref:Chemotaxis protein CheY n=1 Tax=Lacticaseibacillus sharpeae JCM 1186 = DSM 20505 TaxID=1291052 RepID=A0A0R1ZTD0_9LACO|nr:response regulator transcription factor [Lacticaseibacillus sharpeae]KRM54998.1 chemotaxis protein CheY [Lacticaseibacillus sharpeae JCM 1186 = DSM 20505]